MPGWTAPFSTNLGMRGFADRTIEEQTPSHLLGKICWVGNDGYVPDPCAPVVDALAALLQAPHGCGVPVCVRDPRRLRDRLRRLARRSTS